MNPLKTRVAVLLLLAVGAILAGCSTENPSESSIPWNRPANWEGQVPGMGNTPGANQH
jgi:nitrous oxide reductase accessory protein NosL